MTVEIISPSISTKVWDQARTRPGSNSRPLDLQTDSHLLPYMLPTTLRGLVSSVCLQVKLCKCFPIFSDIPDLLEHRLEVVPLLATVGNGLEVKCDVTSSHDVIWRRNGMDLALLNFPGISVNTLSDTVEVF